jgi:hypothetical protein
VDVAIGEAGNKLYQEASLKADSPRFFHHAGDFSLHPHLAIAPDHPDAAL